MTSYLRPLIKGLGPRSHRSAEQELDRARTSVLRWWWEYLRLSRDYWMVCQTTNHWSARTRDERLARVFGAFGDVWSQSFDDWWLSRGYDGFKELKGPPRVLQLSRTTLARQRYASDHIWVDIPLKLSRAAAMRQISKILSEPENQAHRLPNRLEASTADFKVNPVRYRLHTLAVMHDVHCLHRELIAKPDYFGKQKGSREAQIAYDRRADIFRIGKLLNLSPSSARPTAYADELRKRNNVMRATVSRYLNKARMLIANVEIGSFPRFEAPQSRPERFTESQLEQHKQLEEHWWSLELHSTAGASRVTAAKKIHYDEWR